MRLSFLAAAAAALCLFSVQSYAMVGGEAPPLDESPTKSVVYIAFGKSNRCTGAVVAKRLILTSAHCMEYPPFAYRIVFTNDVTPILKREVRAEARAVVETYYPPEIAKVDPLSDDLVLLELNADIPDGIEIAKLPTGELELAAGTSITAYGFGLQNENGYPLSPIPRGEGIPWEPIILKRKTFVTSVPERPEFKGIRLDYHRLFVTQPEGGICSGDSGGPVFIQQNGEQLLVGVNGADVPEFHPGATYAPNCAANAYVTRVDTLADWIQSVIKDHGSSTS